MRPPRLFVALAATLSMVLPLVFATGPVAHASPEAIAGVVPFAPVSAETTTSQRDESPTASAPPGPAPDSRQVPVIEIGQDGRMSLPGESFFILALRTDPATTGVFEYTVPDHVEIRGMQSQSMGQLAYTVSADGRTARSVRDDVPLVSAGIFVNLQVSPDAPPGAVLDGGSTRILSPEGEILAAGTFYLRVAAPPVLTQHPSSTTVRDGATAAFRAEATGDPAPTVRWERSIDDGDTWETASGQATAVDYDTGPTTLDMDGWQYRAVFTNMAGSASSDAATLSVGPLGFLEHPTDLTLDEGTVARFSTRFVPAQDAVFGWEFSTNGGATWRQSAVDPIDVQAGETYHRLLEVGTPNGVTVLSAGRLNRAYLQYADHIVYSDVALMTVNAAPVTVVEQPVSQSVLEGQPGTFSAAHGGTTFPVSAQWQFSIDGGATFSYVPGGATQPSLTIERATLEMDGWQYRVRFTNDAGPVWSDVATLSVSPAGFLVDPVDVVAGEGEMAQFGVEFVPAQDGAFGWEYSADEGASWERTAGDPVPVMAGVAGAEVLELTAEAQSDGFMVRAYLEYAESTVHSGVAGLTVEPVRAVVVEQPVSQSVLEGQAVTFSAAHGGTTFPVSAQWQFSIDGGATFSYVPGGATQPSLTIERATLEMDGWQYRVRFTNDAGPVWSQAVTLTVGAARPVITEHPESVVVNEGHGTAFYAAFTGTDAEVSVQWQFSTDGGQTFSYVPGGATSVPLVITSATSDMNGWQYRVRFTNVAGPIWSQPATLTVRTAPVISAHPLDTSGAVGETATFVAEAHDPAPVLDPVWQVSVDGTDWVDMAPGDGIETEGTALTLGLTAELDGARYRAVFTNDLGTAVSDSALLTVHAPPVISEHPHDVRVMEGRPATFSAATPAVSPDRTQQWQTSRDGQDWEDVVGATDPTYTIDSSTLDLDGTLYRVVFSNATGSTISDAARLTVHPAPTGAVLQVTPRATLVTTLPGLA